MEGAGLSNSLITQSATVTWSAAPRTAAAFSSKYGKKRWMSATERVALTTSCSDCGEGTCANKNTRKTRLSVVVPGYSCLTVAEIGAGVLSSSLHSQPAIDTCSSVP